MHSISVGFPPLVYWLISAFELVMVFRNSLHLLQNEASLMRCETHTYLWAYRLIFIIHLEINLF